MIKNNPLRHALILSLPYLIAIMVAVILFIISDLYIEHPGINNMFISVASTLIGVPTVFLCYDIIRHFTTMDLRRSLFNHFSLEMNKSIHEILLTFQRMLRKSSGKTDELYILKSLNKSEIQKRLRINDLDVKTLHNQSIHLNSIIHGNAYRSALSREEMLMLVNFSRTLNALIHEMTLNDNKHRNLDVIATLMIELLNMMDELSGLGETEGLIEIN